MLWITRFMAFILILFLFPMIIPVALLLWFNRGVGHER